MGIYNLFMGTPLPIDFAFGQPLLTKHLLCFNQISVNGLTGSIMTFYELTEGDMAHTTGTRSRHHLPKHPSIGNRSPLHNR